MRLALDSDPTLNLVRSYGNGAVSIGTQEIRRAFLVSPHELILDWSAASIEALTEADLAPVLTRQANIVLLGAASHAQLPAVAIRRWCRAKGIALESMSLGAACRTYNILATEDRAVIAGLFP